MHIDPKDPAKTDLMVAVLLQYVEDTKKYALPDIQKLLAAGGYPSFEGGAGVGAGGPSLLSPSPPPVGMRPSIYSPGARAAAGGAGGGGGAGGSGGSFTMPNMMGRTYFNREVRSAELVVHSRFFSFPVAEASVMLEQGSTLTGTGQPFLSGNGNGDSQSAGSKQHQRGGGQGKSANFLGNGAGAGTNTAGSGTGAGAGAGAGKAKAKGSASSQLSPGAKSARLRAKHRNLSQHLVTFSGSPACSAAALNMATIQTFVAVSDSHDALTAACSLIALSNVSVGVEVLVFLSFQCSHFRSDGPH